MGVSRTIDGVSATGAKPNLVRGQGPLPPFVWARIVGTPLVDDFGIGADRRLVVSERALAVVLATGPRALDVEPV
jgi:hypothetical protein